MSKSLSLLPALTFFALGLAFAQTPARGTFTYTNPPRCTITNDRTSVTFFQEIGSDGFVVKLEAEEPARRLRFLLKCNGATAKITFRQPERIASGGPALVLGTRYNTIIALDNVTRSFQATTPSIPSTPYSLTYTSHSTNSRLLEFGFGVRSGGNANIPFLAGSYNFRLTATIEAGL